MPNLLKTKEGGSWGDWSCIGDVMRTIAFGLLDRLRPNPKGILTNTIQERSGFGVPLPYGDGDTFYVAQNKEGETFCFVDWRREDEEFNLWSSQYGLALRERFQKELERRGLKEKIDEMLAQPGITPQEFFMFLEQHNILVRGPLPPNLEAMLRREKNVRGYWMPEDLFTLAYGYRNEEEKE
jgi:hypothetical protein